MPISPAAGIPVATSSTAPDRVPPDGSSGMRSGSAVHDISNAASASATARPGTFHAGEISPLGYRRRTALALQLMVRMSSGVRSEASRKEIASVVSSLAFAVRDTTAPGPEMASRCKALIGKLQNESGFAKTRGAHHVHTLLADPLANVKIVAPVQQGVRICAGVAIAMLWPRNTEGAACEAVDLATNACIELAECDEFVDFLGCAHGFKERVKHFFDDNSSACNRSGISAVMQDLDSVADWIHKHDAQYCGALSGEITHADSLRALSALSLPQLPEKPWPASVSNERT